MYDKQDTQRGRTIFRDSSGSPKFLRDGNDFDKGAAGFRRLLRPSDTAVVFNLDLDICRLEN